MELLKPHDRGCRLFRPIWLSTLIQSSSDIRWIKTEVTLRGPPDGRPCGRSGGTRQSRPESAHSRRDCFAEPVLGRRGAPTRGLAMTVLFWNGPLGTFETPQAKAQGKFHGRPPASESHYPGQLPQEQVTAGRRRRIGNNFDISGAPVRNDLEILDSLYRFFLGPQLGPT